MSRRREWAALTLALIVAASLAGCRTTPADDTTGTTIEKPPAKTSVESSATTESAAADDAPGPEEKTELSQEWPTDAPVYEGDVTQSSSSGGTMTLGVRTADAVADVLEWYREQLAGGGWTIVSDRTSETGGTLTANKGGRTLDVTVREAGDNTTILLTFASAP